MESGHRLADVKGYTLDQLDVLTRAHARLARHRLRDACVATRAGQAEAKAFAGLMKQLED